MADEIQRFPEDMTYKGNPSYDDKLMIYDAATGITKQTNVEDISNMVKGQFMGNAVPATVPQAATPELQIWYFAGPGTYANFPGEDSNPVVLTEVLNVISWDGTKATVQGITVDVDLTGYTQNGGYTGTSKILSNEISQRPTKNYLFSVGKNLADVTAILYADSYVNEVTGVISPNVAYDVIRIALTPGTEYYCSKSSHWGYFDDADTFISGVYMATYPFTFTAPTGSVYGLFSVPKSVAANFMIMLNSNPDKTYIPYEGGIIKEAILPLLNTDKISDKAVSIPKTNFIIPGNQLFNINNPDTVIGKYINDATGGLATNALYNTTGYISITAGQVYTMSFKHVIAWYDANKNFISSSPSTDHNTTQTAPANAANLRCTVVATQWSSFMINKGGAILPYEEFKYLLQAPDGTPIESESSSGNNNTPLFAMPSKRYILKGAENNLYFKQIRNKNKPNYYYRVIGQGYLTFDDFARVTNPVTEGSISLKQYNENFVELLSKMTQIVLGDPAVDNGLIKIQAIGDSYTYNAAWVDYVRQLLSNTTYLGMRVPYGGPTIKVEGRGGWTMAAYFNRLHSTTDSFTPFMHPSGYKYYGNTDFWTKVTANSTDYGYNGFQAIGAAIGFNSNGFKTTPAVNDLMWDDTNGKYVYYNGSAWVDAALTDADFVCNYAQYRATWGIDAPDYVAIMLGVNDFIGQTSEEGVAAVFASYKTQMDTLVTSIKADTPTVKIAIMLPVVNFGPANNYGGEFTEMQQYMMFYGRKSIIDTYDNRTAESIYVVDGGSCVDPIYGFTEITATALNKPFSQYTGSEVRYFINNSPHPSTQGYYQLGVPLAAMIQATR